VFVTCQKKLCIPNLPPTGTRPTCEPWGPELFKSLVAHAAHPVREAVTRDVANRERHAETWKLLGDQDSKFGHRVPGWGSDWAGIILWGEMGHEQVLENSTPQEMVSHRVSSVCVRWNGL